MNYLNSTQEEQLLELLFTRPTDEVIGYVRQQLADAYLDAFRLGRQYESQIPGKRVRMRLQNPLLRALLYASE